MIPRNLLPQIPGDQIEKFQLFLRGRGVRTSTKQLPVADLQPIQSHVNPNKVDALKRTPKLTTPLIVSSDGYILDGHHRWLAEKELGERSTILCIQCACSIKKLIGLGHQFDGSFTKTVEEGLKI